VRRSGFGGRKELDVVLGRDADDLVEVGHLVQLVEELLEPAGGDTAWARRSC